MFVVSAPGKVILFGEHAVVHGVPAIAASVSLRTFVSVEPSADVEVVELDFPEVGLALKWRRSELPWASAKRDHSSQSEGHVAESLPEAHTQLREDLVEAISAIIARGPPASSSFAHVSALAFAYLYLNLCTPDTPGHRFVSRAALPVGAGLGSSASFSVCLATALLRLGGTLTDPSATTDSEAALKAINDWAYLGECCIHGSPSGIDNLVAARGGAVLFRRRAGAAPDMTPYASFPPLRLILTNTGVPRRTSELVANVGALLRALPTLGKQLIGAIGEVVAEATSLLGAAEQAEDASSLAAALGRLAEINHGLLVSLGVSHPALERVRAATQELGLGATKLTGAGGGGCAITLAAPGAHARIDELRRALGEPFEVFETELGGPGAGVVEASVDLTQPLEPAVLDSLSWGYYGASPAVGTKRA